MYLLPSSPPAEKATARQDQKTGQASTRDGAGNRNRFSAPRIAGSKKGVPAMFGGVASLDLINGFATNRTKPNMNPPTAVPDITEAGT
jgi:hypothetical protein